MLAFLEATLQFLAGLVFTGAVGWSALAIRYWNRGSLTGRRWLACAWLFGWLLFVVGSSCNVTSLIAFWSAFGLLFLAWFSIPARKDLEWEPWHARQSRGELDGERLLLRDIRNFRWRSRTDAEPAWETREYDLRELNGVDFVTSNWGIRGVVHTLASFRFGEDEYLCLSIETRLERGEAQNPVAGLFKQYELVYLFADERDVLALRTNVRLEQTRIFPLTLTPEKARQLLIDSVEAANRLAEQPRFYNTLWRNCLTSFVPILSKSHRLGFDLSMILNGHFDAFGVERQLIDTELSIEQARERFAADDHGRSKADLADFSRRVRPWRYENPA